MSSTATAQETPVWVGNNVAAFIAAHDGYPAQITEDPEYAEGCEKSGATVFWAETVHDHIEDPRKAVRVPADATVQMSDVVTLFDEIHSLTRRVFDLEHPGRLTEIRLRRELADARAGRDPQA